MSLGRRNLVYSMLLAGAMLLFLVGYFINMLPSLYVDYVMEQNLKSVCEQHRAYVESGSYEGVRVKNSTACFSLEIPTEGERVLITGKSFSAEVLIKAEALVRILDRCREKLLGAKNRGEETDMALEPEMEELGIFLQEFLGRENSLPVEVRFLYLRDMQEEFFNESIKVHFYSDDMFVVESCIEDSANRYTNYMAAGWADESLILSFLPVVSPDAEEIRPVVLQSLPMLGAVIVLVVLLFSRIYSKGIVNPIEELVEHAEQMKQGKNFPVEPLSVKWRGRQDEVGKLADTLDEFYAQIRESYRELEEKNDRLEEENKRQEIFLRASSHQLKTPIAAALLLVEGMMNGIGRYADTQAYLPKVKEELLSMRRMVEDILYLNHCAENMNLQRMDGAQVLKERLKSYQVALADKKLEVEFEGGGSLSVETDEMMLSQILDNLLSNAVHYTPSGGRIRIALCGEGAERKISIENYGVKIPGELLSHIFDPFVSGRDRADSRAGERGHGLGLYIASYYARKLGLSLTVQNSREGVAATLVFPSPV